MDWKGIWIVLLPSEVDRKFYPRIARFRLSDGSVRKGLINSKFKSAIRQIPCGFRDAQSELGNYSDLP